MNEVLVSESTILSKVKNTRSKRTLRALDVPLTDKDLPVLPPSLKHKNEKEKNKRPKRTLRALQVSATDKDLLVPSPSLMPKNEKKIKEVKKSFKILSDDVQESKEDQENITRNGKLSKVPSKSKKVTAAKKNKKQKQSKIDSFIVEPTSCIALESVSSTILESTQKISESSVNTAEITVIPNRSVSDDAVAMLTSDHPPESYWKDLAEQRRLALEKALYENAQLWDQLQVLEAENSQLKGCVEEAEKMAEIVRQALQ
ncbi:uncharacterized protein NPIL_545821 [Nephila pilipes]|uniref:Geminin n=1 Tax=Nephila pilipes TaxID=299642 RepID=A0A8X6M8Z1_NEPPI|nr:uncharacterized protein NPIL_545821 [Nephila pilipes]